MLINKEQLNHTPTKVYNKKQQNILARSLGVAALAFLLVVAVGYGIFLGVENNSITDDTYNILSSVGIIASFVMLGAVMMFQPSIPMYIGLFLAYILSAGVGFGSLFFSMGEGELLMIFGLAGVVMGLTAILGFILPTKAIGSIAKFSFYSFMLGFVISLVFVLVAVFATTYDFAWYNYLIIILFLFGTIGYNIYLFHSISKMDDFYQENLTKQQLHLIVLMFGFNIFVSFIQLVWYLAYLFRN